MAATITRLRSKPERIQAEQADKLRQLLLEFPALPEWERTRLVAELDRLTPSTSGWTFVQLSAEQNAAVVAWIIDHSVAPMVAAKVWAVCFTKMNRQTGEIALTRDEIADEVGTQRKTISEIMSELEERGAIIRKREKVAGMRGPGMVRYFMNPNVATHLAGAARDRAQAAAPKLRVVESKA